MLKYIVSLVFLGVALLGIPSLFNTSGLSLNVPSLLMVVTLFTAFVLVTTPARQWRGLLHNTLDATTANRYVWLAYLSGVLVSALWFINVLQSPGIQGNIAPAVVGLGFMPLIYGILLAEFVVRPWSNRLQLQTT